MGKLTLDYSTGWARETKTGLPSFSTKSLLRTDRIELVKLRLKPLPLIPSYWGRVIRINLGSLRTKLRSNRPNGRIEQ